MSEHDSTHPPGEHESELPDEDDAVPDERTLQEENAETSQDEPSDGSGGE
jgi:hypothetical protein